MIIRADLHMHTIHSLDGEWQALDLLESSQEAGLSIISITDHNLIRGVPEALSHASKFDIRVIPGIEIDCNYKGIDLHLLGYNIKWGSRDFIELEARIAAQVMESFVQMVINLRKSGIDVDEKEVLEKAGGRLPSAELIAEVLLGNSIYGGNKMLDPYRAGGERSDMPYLNFYLDFFAQGKPAYVKIKYMDYAEAVAMVNRNNGIPIVAHPGLNLTGKEEMAEELIQAGAKGLEVFNNYHNARQMEYFADLAVRQNMLMTCGSDFHGRNKPLIRVGEFMTLDRYEGYLNQSVEELLC